MKKILKLICLSMGMLLTFENVNAQIDENAIGYYNEALRFSRTVPGGTARIQAIGGTQIALGGDVSNIYSNPAGLGFFNRSQVSFTPSLKLYSNDSEYFGLNTRDNGGRFGFDNLGVVFSSPRSNANSSWRGGSFGISYTKTNNFNDQFTYEGRNPNSSIIDQFIENANGILINDLNGLTGLAYDIFLINPAIDDVGNPIDGAYDSFIFGLPFQREIVTTEGSQSQWSISYGGNVADRFYFGIGLGITSVNYEQTKSYSESNFDAPDPGINDFTIRERLNIDGSGINATVGFIFRPNDHIRIGASLVTPTYYQFDEESDVIINASYDNFFYEPENITLGEETVQSDIFISTYDLTTPLRLNGGVAFFFGKNGFISADVEYIDYGNSSLSSNDFSTTADNRTIESLYTSVVNFRVGGEYRHDVFRFRAGFGYHDNPYTTEDIDLSRTELSLGAGVRFKKFYADLGVVTNLSEERNYSPYTFFDGTGPVANIATNNTNAILTVGFNF